MAGGRYAALCNRSGAAHASSALPLQRYWVKANLWIAIFSFIGNYFWTHYFSRLLGAAYTFPAHQLNEARPSPA